MTDLVARYVELSRLLLSLSPKPNYVVLAQLNACWAAMTDEQRAEAEARAAAVKVEP